MTINEEVTAALKTLLSLPYDEQELGPIDDALVHLMRAIGSDDIAPVLLEAIKNGEANERAGRRLSEHG